MAGRGGNPHAATARQPRAGQKAENCGPKFNGADCIMNESIFIGVYPGLTQAMMDYMVEIIRQFVRKK
jgi:CDP-6-deoxy-D-xylo-4-hexulose-3-dehydrase